MPAAAQPAELYALTQAWTWVKGKIANNFSDSKHVYWVALDFGML